MNNSILSLAMDAIPYGPTAVEASDANAALPDAVLTNANGHKPIYVTISCEDNPIRYAFGGIVPTQAGTGHILYPGSVLKLGHPAAVASFKYINHTNGSNAVIQITGEYGV